MKPLSPYAAVGEGFRLIWREPRAALAWAVLWLATFSISGWVVAVTRPAAAQIGQEPESVAGVAAQLGPLWPLLILLFLVVWLVTVVAAFRAVLHPEQRRVFYLRLGGDEWRLGLLTVAAFLAAIPLGAAPAYGVFVLANPFMAVLPAAARDIAAAGVLLTVWIDVWLGVRLSLIAVETFSERRFHLTSYWPVTRGRFWYLLACYFLFFLALLGLTALAAPLIGLLSQAGADRVQASGLGGRGGILLQAGLLAGAISVYWTISSTVFCAMQAHAFRAIVGEGHDGVPPA